MSEYIRLVRLGMRDLSVVGAHPGTFPLFFMCILFGLAGLDRGLFSFSVGYGVIFCLFFPLYCIGAYERAVWYEKSL